MLSRAKREVYESRWDPPSGLLKFHSATTTTFGIPGYWKDEQEENHPGINGSPSPLPVGTLNSQRATKNEIVRLRLRGRRQPLQTQRITGGPTTKPPRCTDRIGVGDGVGDGLRGPGVEEIIGEGVG